MPEDTGALDTSRGEVLVDVCKEWYTRRGVYRSGSLVKQKKGSCFKAEELLGGLEQWKLSQNDQMEALGGLVALGGENGIKDEGKKKGNSLKKKKKKTKT